MRFDALLRGMRDLYLLEPDVAFLNHGYAGACPRPVFDASVEWQRRCEAEPVDFLSREAPARLAEVRHVLGDWLDADPNDLALMTNGTQALNAVARSLDLGPGDELLMTDHEHGGIERAFRYMAERRGFRIVRQPVPLPVTSHAEFAEWFMAQVTERTRAILLSQVTASSALVMPVAGICRRARELGILTIIDGAHGPGHLPLSLRALGADFYAGILHKWLGAPKTCAFLHARRAMQDRLEPLVVSWGWRPDAPGPSRFIDEQEGQGSRSLAPLLSVPAAMAFQREHDWPSVSARCTVLAREAQRRIEALTGLPSIQSSAPEWRCQMAAVRLPDAIDAPALQRRLRCEHQVDVSVERHDWGPRLRVSVQGYNDEQDIERLLTALKRLL